MVSEDDWNKSRERWRNCNPDEDLTWGVYLTGDPFISKVSSYNVFSPEKSILEVGPGYGRLLKSILTLNIPFSKYLGVDISPKITKFLSETFKEHNIRFIQGDIETISLDSRFDIVLSSLTFMHLYPSLAKALNNIVKHMNPQGTLFFDVVEGTGGGFPNPTHFIRGYTREEIQETLRDLSLESIDLSTVQHTPAFDYATLMFVAARKGIKALIIFGEPQSGKSLYAAERMMKESWDGIVCSDNIALKTLNIVGKKNLPNGGGTKVKDEVADQINFPYLFEQLLALAILKFGRGKNLIFEGYRFSFPEDREVLYNVLKIFGYKTVTLIKMPEKEVMPSNEFENHKIKSYSTIEEPPYRSDYPYPQWFYETYFPSLRRWHDI